MVYAKMNFDQEFEYIYALRLDRFKRRLLLEVLFDPTLTSGKKDAQERRRLLAQGVGGGGFYDEAAMKLALDFLQALAQPPKSKSGKRNLTTERLYRHDYINILANIYSVRTLKQIARETDEYINPEVIRMIRDFQVSHQEGLRELFARGTPAFQGNMAIALALAGHKEWAPNFTRLLAKTSDDHLKVCLHLASASLGEKGRTDSLYAFLDHNSTDVQDNAAAALIILEAHNKIKLSSPRILAWAQKRYAIDEEVTANAIYLLGKSGQSEQGEVINFLFTLLPPKRENSNAGSRSSLNQIVAGRDERRVSQVVDALVTLGGPRVLGEINRRLAAMSAKASKRRQAGGKQTLLAGSEAECCLRVLCTLGDKNDRLRALNLAVKGDTSLKRACILSLATKPDQELFRRMVELVKSDPDLKFVGALVLVGNRGDRTLLQQLLPENDPLAKAYLKVLMGDSSGLAFIAEQIDSRDINQVLRATNMAAQLANEKLLPALRRAGEYSNDDYAPYDMRVRRAAWNGLAKIYARRLASGKAAGN